MWGGALPAPVRADILAGAGGCGEVRGPVLNGGGPIGGHGSCEGIRSFAARETRCDWPVALEDTRFRAALHRPGEDVQSGLRVERRNVTQLRSAFLTQETVVADGGNMRMLRTDSKIGKGIALPVQHVSDECGMLRDQISKLAMHQDLSQYAVPHQGLVYPVQTIDKPLERYDLALKSGRLGAGCQGQGYLQTTGNVMLGQNLTNERRYDAQLGSFNLRSRRPEEASSEGTKMVSSAFNQFESVSSLWQPGEKSSMFGPGLFGIQDHKF